jgi:hypothetical protein
VHHEVDAETDRLLVDGARKGVVDDRRDASSAAGRRDGADIQAAKRRVDGCFEPEEARAAGQRALRHAQLVETEKARAHTEVREKVGEDVQRAAVDGCAAHDLIATLRQRQQRRCRRRHAGREEERRFATLEVGDRSLDGDHRRVRIP